MKIEFQMSQLLEQGIRTRFFTEREFPDTWQLGKSSFILVVKSKVQTLFSFSLFILVTCPGSFCESMSELEIKLKNYYSQSQALTTRQSFSSFPF